MFVGLERHESEFDRVYENWSGGGDGISLK
jgi:hypothetical protein